MVTLRSSREEHTISDVARAKRELRNSRDVVCFCVEWDAMRPRTFKSKDWLDYFVSEKYGESAFLLQEEPFLRAATDGCTAVATPLAGPAEKTSSASTHVLSFLRRLWPRPGEKVVGHFTSDEFEIACGQLERLYASPCRRCGGSGNVSHECACKHCQVKEEECSACDGRKVKLVEPEQRCVLVGGRPVDANRLAYILHCCPAVSTVVLYLGPGDHAVSLAGNADSVGDGTQSTLWVAAVACMAPDDDKLSTAPDLVVPENRQMTIEQAIQAPPRGAKRMVNL